MINILLIADKAAVRCMLRIRLEVEPDLRVIAESEHAEQALTIVSQLPLDVILMDMTELCLDGIQALRAAAPAGRVILSGLYGDPGTRGRAIEAGAFAFVEKSEGDAVLLATIRGVINA